MKCIKCNKPIQLDEVKQGLKPDSGYDENAELRFKHACGQIYYTFVAISDLTPLEED